MSSEQQRVLRDVLNAFNCRGLSLDWAGTDSHLFLRGVVGGHEVVVGNRLDDLGFVEVAVYDLGDFDAGAGPVTVLERLDCWDAAAAAWLLGVAYRAGNWAPKPLVG